jgi:hypothetical protein
VKSVTTVTRYPISPKVQSTSCSQLDRKAYTNGWSPTKIFDLLQLCPEVVLGKYAAVTSIDSGPLVPTEKEMAAGWQSHGKVAYSPKIQHTEELPREGWDEWYIFNNPTDLGTSHLAENIFEVPNEQGHLSVFVNYGFALDPPERSESFASMFWQQLARIRPESYVADNDYLSFVSMNKTLFFSVHNAVKALGTH